MPGMNWLLRKNRRTTDSTIREGQEAVWTVCRNALAPEASPRDQERRPLFYYHTGDKGRWLASPRLLATAYPDPEDTERKILRGDVAPVTKLPRPVTLAEIKRMRPSGLSLVRSRGCR